MVNLYKVVKEKTGVIGYWQDKAGKVYQDNIKIIPIHSIGQFEYEKDLLFKSGELAIFYIVNGQAYIENCSGEITILKNRIAWKEKEISKSLIDTLLSQHEGFTVYKGKECFIIEIWK